MTIPAEVHTAIRYLTRWHRWAATSHPGFGEYAADLARLHARLERATGRHRSATRAAADCFECGGDLVRRIDRHGLEEDVVTCDVCGEKYPPQRYLLAVKAKVEEGSRVTLDGETYVTLRLAADETGRSEHTLRKWAAEGAVRRHTQHGMAMVCLADAAVVSADRKRRQTA